MKTFLQSLLSIFRLYKWTSVLNVIGLSVAFTAFYIIIRQSWYEYRFDKSYPEHELIFRVERDVSNQADNFVRPELEQRLSASPHIKTSGICYKYPVEARIYKSDVSTDVYRGNVTKINKGYTDVFGFEWVSGNISEFDRSDKNIIIPASMAKKIFGTVNAAGKQVKMEYYVFDGGEAYCNIVAVYKDFPDNSTIFNGIYVSLNNYMEDVWYNGGFRGYVKIDKKENIKLIENAMKKDVSPDPDKSVESQIKLFPMDDIYFYSNDAGDVYRTLGQKGDLKLTWLLFSFACLLILVAIINFSNLSMALAPVRIKSFNTQKVLGASVRSLRFQYLMECVVISFIAFLLSLLFVQMVSMSDLSKLFITDIHLKNELNVLGFCAVFSIIVGLVVGIYPSIYMTSVPAAIALKGSFRLSPKGVYFRNLLIGFQFTVTFVFLIISLFYYFQNRYMLNSPLGFDKDGVVVVKIGWHQRNSDMMASIENNLKNYAGCEYVFATDNLLLNKNGVYQCWGREGGTLWVIVATQDVIPGLGIKITEGRTFNPDEFSGKMVVNEFARREYDFKLGDRWNGYEIIGFIPDLKIFSFYKSSGVPLALLVGDEAGEDRRFNMYMKLKSGVKREDAIAYCKKIVEPFESLGLELPVLMLEDVAEELYEEDINRMTLFSLFCGLNMFIAIMGVFGLIIFELQSRRKEIGIRKINGATVLSVIMLFNKIYIRILIICFVIAVPIAWRWAQTWLEGYVYHIPVYWWIFAAAFFILSVITVLTVSLQCWHTANENPIKSLKVNE